MRAKLVPADGGTPIDICKDVVLVGRKEDCDVQLDHKSISKQHCVLVKTDGLLLLRDLGSTNGTRVNGQRVRRAALLPNDRLSIASLSFRVEFADDNEPDSAPEEYTQQMDAAEIQRLFKKTTEDIDDDSSEEIDLPPIQANALPDNYDEPQKKR